MNNSELLQTIENKEATGLQNISSVSSEDSLKFVIFSMKEKLYSLPAEMVLEIFLTDNIFYIPFCPLYVSGFINRYGEPYTVIDLLALLENEKQNTRKFIILRRKESQIAFMVEDVIDILSFPKNKILWMSPKESEGGFFSGVIQDPSNDIFILQLDKILQRLENDME